MERIEGIYFEMISQLGLFVIKIRKYQNNPNFAFLIGDIHADVEARYNRLMDELEGIMQTTSFKEKDADSYKAEIIYKECKAISELLSQRISWHTETKPLIHVLTIVIENSIETVNSL